MSEQLESLEADSGSIYWRWRAEIQRSPSALPGRARARHTR